MANNIVVSDNLVLKQVSGGYSAKELLFQMYMDKKYTDTIIKGYMGNIVRAHSLILKDNEVFKNRLLGQPESEEKVVNLPQFPIEIIRVIIEYLYRGKAYYYKAQEQECIKAFRYFFGSPSDMDQSDVTSSQDLIKSQNSSSDASVSSTQNVIEPQMLTETQDTQMTYMPSSDEPSSSQHHAQLQSIQDESIRMNENNVSELTMDETISSQHREPSQSTQSCIIIEFQELPETQDTQIFMTAREEFSSSQDHVLSESIPIESIPTNTTMISESGEHLENDSLVFEPTGDQ